MPFVSRLRKEMLQALDNYIIPALKSSTPPIAYVDDSLCLPPGITVSKISSKVLSSENASPGDWPVLQTWPKENLLTKECPCLSFIYEGFADERIAVLKETGSKEKSRKTSGIYALHLEAPCARYIPPGFAHVDGEKLFWEREYPENAFSRILQLRLFSTNVLAHLSCTQNGKHTAAHSLQIQDQSLVLTARLFIEELQNTSQKHQDVANAFLLAIMCSLRKNILNNTVRLTNTSWPHIPAVSAKSVSPRLQELCEDTVQYIQLYLHEKLTLRRIAQHGRVTPQHLNWAFHQVLGISVMRYVTHQRVEAAKLILFEREEHIQDIAQLVGFAHYNTFCSVFRRETHMSPGEYRRYSKQKLLSDTGIDVTQSL